MANNTGDLKKFAQSARRQLREQVAGRLEQVLRTDSAELRQKEAAIKELKQQIAQTSKKAVIDRVAYIWFNRFCALRFMDVNRYTRIGIVSPAEGYSQPEILQEAKQGYIDEELNRFVNRQGILDLLSGKIPSKDPQQEAYRLLLVGVCNSYNTIMPFLFERIEDYTELLMPLDLLSDNSILHDLREVMTPETCQDVEIIGWLYQYYISERKDEVFEALKQNQKIEAEDIPAATQLFTPHWIVRYLVENSLGRLWMLNRPKSRLVEKMEFYIKPIQEETDFLKISKPEEIKICDPACGSGHMLTYAFDLLYSIYEEEGYASTDIPGLILHNNLFGIEIDERAGALAAFALFMKARGKYKRFFTRDTQPNICVLENVSFTDQELKEYMNAVGLDLFTEALRETLKQFEQADNFGSLIQPVLTDAAYVYQLLAEKTLGNNLFLFGIHERVLKVLRQGEYLSQRYHVVLTNPPYMGGSGMNDELKEFTKTHYPKSKADLFAMFIEGNLNLVKKHGLVGMITMQSWMFLTSYEELREDLIIKNNILTMAHLGPRAFDSIGGEVVSTTAFIIKNSFRSTCNGIYFRLVDGGNETEKSEMLKNEVASFNNKKNVNCFEISPADFKKIPGSPIVYWVKNNIRDLFPGIPLNSIAHAKFGMSNGDRDFSRCWWEPAFKYIYFQSRNALDFSGNRVWAPYDKGGPKRKWYGNHYDVVFWKDNGNAIKNHPKSAVRNADFFCQEHLSWTLISSSSFAARYFEAGFLLDTASNAVYFKENGEDLKILLSFLNTKIVSVLLNLLNPTVNFSCGVIGLLPFKNLPADQKLRIQKISNKAIEFSKSDWDEKEFSWNFNYSPILQNDIQNKKIKEIYFQLRKMWEQRIHELKQLEEENNEIFIKTFSLQEELTPEVLLEDITINCNPHYYYNGNKSESELNDLLLAETMREFISYSVGCMFGRYSLDKPGLILANEGETLQDYMRQIPDPTFTPDEDNAIPILDGDWFSDDITERFKKFLRLTFGDGYYDENLAFIEDAIGRDIRGYFLKEFYAYHVKMYQKRPIYWLFSSPKGSFNVLIYMHRYNKDTISVILNRYLREFRAKLEARKSYLEQISISVSASPKEKTSALKDIEKLSQTLEELRVYERDVLYPLATQRIEIELDDGVKVNYAKFGKALRPI